MSNSFMTNKRLRNIRVLRTLLLAVAACVTLSACQPNNESEAKADLPIDKSPESHAAKIWPVLDLAIKPDEDIETRVKSILQGMTLEQKVAQVIQPEIRDITVEDMRKYGFGSYLNGRGS